MSENVDKRRERRRSARVAAAWGKYRLVVAASGARVIEEQSLDALGRERWTESDLLRGYAVLALLDELVSGRLRLVPGGGGRTGAGNTSPTGAASSARGDA